MHPIGANTWIWVSPLTDARLAALAPRIHAWGFDVIELPVESPGDWDPDRAADLLAGLGLGATVCAVMSADRDLVTDDAEVVRRTGDYLRYCVRVAARVGAGVVAGPMYAPVGRTWLLDADARAATVRTLRDRLRPLAEEAAGAGVTLAVEPLNRFETSLLNTTEQALEVVDGIPGLGLALDTFHMNIEERDIPTAIRTAGDRLAHVQVCANDRGAPGNDHLDWTGIVAALRDVGYDGPLCIESFTAENRTIATAAAIWRPLAPTQDKLATGGLAFLRALLARIGPATGV
ncbi:sugar phosphate isomerase/epimerase family protein [Micromonospora endolithica]|uniref:Sugar phosphate isomerase/epimerase n=1 Tax=Micromonospora endolithica TaxID=230091 RepID=A0A3A9ZK45_9ACTN|nr:sugar phosphate isomerase/epimerase family protein [Micromonospora endolithica]RKN48648.1 sugar phosphate isomerase/epimerase [Micromonospora endolithica]TWJ22015.1 D-psicose/D-tagatose/L-ribulose 3-epimerase [Micromonospora endolithica]